MSSFRSEGLELHYEVHGDGEPVVLLHGFTSSGGHWEEQGWVELLVAHRFRPIAPDVRSHGSSSRVYALELALGWPARVRRLVVAGIGGAAINALHDPAEIQALAEAFACPEGPAHPDSSAARIRSHALRAGNDLRALLPFAEADEHMAETDALVAALRAALDFLLARDP